MARKPFPEGLKDLQSCGLCTPAGGPQTGIKGREESILKGSIKEGG